MVPQSQQLPQGVGRVKAPRQVWEGLRDVEAEGASAQGDPMTSVTVTACYLATGRPVLGVSLRYSYSCSHGPYKAAEGKAFK